MADARAQVAQYNRELAQRVRERDRDLARVRPMRRERRWFDFPEYFLTDDTEKRQK